MRRVVISLDYDGCGDVLFTADHPEILAQYRTPASWDVEKEKYLLARRKVAEHINRDINQSLQAPNEFEKGEKYGLLKAPVMYYIGSGRQSESADMLNQSCFNNGSCFANSKLLCEDSGWIYNELLYSEDQSDFTKIKQTQLQIDDAKRIFPNNKIDFHFYDDHDGIIDVLRENLRAPENSIVILWPFDTFFQDDIGEMKLKKGLIDTFVISVEHSPIHA